MRASRTLIRTFSLDLISLPPTSHILHPFIGIEPQSMHRLKPCQPGPPVHVFTPEYSPNLLGCHRRKVADSQAPLNDGVASTATRAMLGNERERFSESTDQ